MIAEKVFMQRVVGVAVSLIVVILLSHPSEARRVDCTKFVFAPICRGVAAKRGLTPLFTPERESVDRIYSAGLDEAAGDVEEEVGKNGRQKTEGGLRLRSDPVSDYLRIRIAEMTDQLRSAQDIDERLTEPFAADILQGKYQKAYRHRRSAGQF